DRFAAIQARALTLRQAFKLRDELLAALPYYSQWLGRVFLTEPQSRKNFVERGPLAPAENLWLNLNKLDALLPQPDPQKLDDLPALLKPIEDDWKSLKADFAKRCDREYEFVQASWHEIEALLAVPFIRPEVRVNKLLERVRRISSELNLQTDRAGDVAGISKTEHDDLVQAQAEGNGRLGLAALGEEAFEAAKGEE